MRNEIAKAANVILTGRAANATGPFEDIKELFVGMPTIEKRAVMHPYGYVSRAMADVMSVVGRQGDSLGNRVVLGHRDEDRPELEAEGEVMLYNGSGEQIYLKEGKVIVTSDEIHLVKEDPSDNAALASLVKQEIKAVRDTLNSLVSTYNGHTHLAGTLLTGPSPGSPVTGVTGSTPSTGTPPSPVNDVKSDKVKLE